jgi:hypothetical protein
MTSGNEWHAVRCCLCHNEAKGMIVSPSGVFDYYCWVHAERILRLDLDPFTDTARRGSVHRGSLGWGPP